MTRWEILDAAIELEDHLVKVQIALKKINHLQSEEQ